MTDDLTVEEVAALRDSLTVVAPTDVVSWLNLLVYGLPGVGKTYLMGTAEDADRTGPVLIFDVEGGMTTLRNRPNVDVIPIRSMNDLVEAYGKLYKSIRNGKMYYKTIGIDSLTELADLDVKEIMKAAYASNPDKIDPDIPDQRGWGKSRGHIRSIVRNFRDLPCNVIYTASEATQQEEGKPTLHFPGFAGKLRTEVPGFMDIVGYYYAEVNPTNGEVRRRLQVQGTRSVVAKDRTGSLGLVVDNPTIPDLWDLIHSTSSAASQSASSSDTEGVQ